MGRSTGESSPCCAPSALTAASAVQLPGSAAPQRGRSHQASSGHQQDAAGDHHRSVRDTGVRQLLAPPLLSGGLLGLLRRSGLLRCGRGRLWRGAGVWARAV